MNAIFCSSVTQISSALYTDIQFLTHSKHTAFLLQSSTGPVNVVEGVCLENHKEHINILRQEYAELLVVTAGGV